MRAYWYETICVLIFQTQPFVVLVIAVDPPDVDVGRSCERFDLPKKVFAPFRVGPVAEVADLKDGRHASLDCSRDNLTHKAGLAMNVANDQDLHGNTLAHPIARSPRNITVNAATFEP